MGFIIGFFVIALGAVLLGVMYGMGVLVWGEIKRASAPKPKGPIGPVKARASQEAARARVIAEAKARNPWLK